MLARVRPRLTYANVMATLALFVALGGSSYAAHLITSKDIKNRSVKGGDLRLNTLTGKEINESKMGQVPNASNAVTAASAASATNSLSAATADVANNAQALAGQNAAAFEKSSRTQFGKASATPAGESGEAVVLSWPELGAQVTSASPASSGCGGGTVGIAVKNTKSSGNVELLQEGGDAAAPPGGKDYMCAGSGDESLNAAVTDSSGRTLFVSCVAANSELRCIGTRSEP